MNDQPIEIQEQPGKVEETFRDKGFAVLGEHGAKVTTTTGNTLRVRFFVNGEEIDEDLPIPAVKTYEEIVEEMCKKRLEELRAK